MTEPERKRIPWDLIAHSGFGDSTGSEPDVDDDIRSSPWTDTDPSEHDQENASNIVEASLQKLKLGNTEFIINSTISQDQTGGAEQTKDALLASLAQKFLKLHEIPFQKQKQTPEKELVRSVIASGDAVLERHFTTEMLQRLANYQSQVRTEKEADRMSNMSQSASSDGGLPPIIRLARPEVPEKPAAEARHPWARYISEERIADSPGRIYKDSASNSSFDYRPLNHFIRERSIPRPPETERYLPIKEGLRDWPTFEPPEQLDSSNDVHRDIRTRRGPSPLQDEALESDSNEPSHEENASEYLQQALEATDIDLRDAQNVLSSLTAEEEDRMISSELDPISYYFAHLKSRHSGETNSADQPEAGRLPLEETIKQPRLENPTKVTQHETTLSQKLNNMRSLISPEEELQILEESLKERLESESIRTSRHSHKIDTLQDDQSSQREEFGSSINSAIEFVKRHKASTPASSYTEVTHHSYKVEPSINVT
jgi:hypothetical protein